MQNTDESKPHRAPSGALRISIMATMGLLLIEFFLGIWLNLYSSFSTGSITSNPGFPELVSHIVIGFVLGALSIFILILALRTGARPFTIIGIIGLVSIFAALIGGITFETGGFTNSALSYLMATGFIIAFIVYGNLASRVVGPRPARVPSMKQ